MSLSEHALQRSARIAMLALGPFALVTGLRQISDPDYWTHLALGRAHVAARAVSIAEPFLAGADIPTQPVRSPEWLFQVPLYLWRTLAGDAGVSVAVAGVTAVIALLTFWPLRRVTATPRLAAGTMLVAAVLLVSRFRFVPRPELGTYVLLLLALLLARSFTAQPRWTPLVFLLGVVVVWRQMHVSWTMGAVFSGLVLAFRPRLDFWRRQPRWLLTGAGLLCAAAGVEAARFGSGIVVAIARGGVLSEVTEMRPTWEFPLIAGGFAATWVAGALAAWGSSEGRVGRLVLLAAAAVLGAVVVRNVAFSLLVTGWAAAEGLAAPSHDRAAGPMSRLAPLAAGVVLALLGALALADRDPPPGVGVDWRWFPRDAAEWVRARHVPGPVFNSWTIGGYLDFAWGGRPPTFLDGRLGGAGRLALHDAVEEASTVDAALATGGFGTLVIAPLYWNDGMLVGSVPWLLAHPGWRLVRASDALVFVRTPLPAGIEPLDPSEGWRTVLRAAEPVGDQTYVRAEHLPFTRATAYLHLGERALAQREFTEGRRRYPEIAARYRGLAGELARQDGRP